MLAARTRYAMQACAVFEKPSKKLGLVMARD